MNRSVIWKLPLFVGLVVAPFVLTGCTTSNQTASALKSAKSTRVAAAGQSGVKNVGGVKTYTYTARDKECLERAMFFESNRSSPDGLVAVGTVVMNRLVSGKYSDSICGVVGQKNQFAPGVLSRKMDSRSLPDVQAAADAVLSGQRHPAAKNSMFFHTAGRKFSYPNMHYVLVAGGNAFYEKRNRDGSLLSPVPDEPYNLAMAYTPQDQAMPQGAAYSVITPNEVPVPAELPGVMVASAQPVKQAETVAPGTTADVLGAQSLRSDRLANKRVPPVGAQPVQLASATVYQPTPSQVSQHALALPQASLGFGADQKQVDAIGAMLLAQDRPEPTFP